MPGFAVAPDTQPEMHDALVDAVTRAGGTLVALDQADALIWADPKAAASYPEVIAAAPRVRWIQLPWAGIEPFAAHLDPDHLWTCGKGVYAQECAEWIMTALLAGFRDIPRYARATGWLDQQGRNLLGSRLTILGAGGITESFLRLIEPWGCDTTVVRRQATPVAGATRTVPIGERHEAVASADAVIVCLALTNETHHIVDRELLASMPDDAWLINVARGGHVDHAALVDALDAGSLGGAVLDVTDPEPLPDGHPLWAFDNVLITPHVGNTPEMGLPLLINRVEENVRRWIQGEELIGTVDVAAGY
jgi:phosphoglycerate dehydrogenase-like enzyme